MVVTKVIDKWLEISIDEPELSKRLEPWNSNGDDRLDIADFDMYGFMATSVMRDAVAGAMEDHYLNSEEDKCRCMSASEKAHVSRGIRLFFETYNTVKEFSDFVSALKYYQLNGWSPRGELELYAEGWKEYAVPYLGDGDDSAKANISAVTRKVYESIKNLVGESGEQKSPLISWRNALSSEYICEIRYSGEKLNSLKVLKGPTEKMIQMYLEGSKFLLQFEDIECEGYDCPFWNSEYTIKGPWIFSGAAELLKDISPANVTLDIFNSATMIKP